MEQSTASLPSRRTETPIRPGIRRHRKHSTRAFHPRSIPCPGHTTQMAIQGILPGRRNLPGHGGSSPMADEAARLQDDALDQHEDRGPAGIGGVHDQVSPCLTRPICDSSWTTRAVPVTLPTRVVLLHSTPSGFGVDLMLKDPGLAAEASMQARATTPLGERTGAQPVRPPQRPGPRHAGFFQHPEALQALTAGAGHRRRSKAPITGAPTAGAGPASAGPSHGAASPGSTPPPHPSAVSRNIITAKPPIRPTVAAVWWPLRWVSGMTSCDTTKIMAPAARPRLTG